ncbi:ankyrin repeat domain-containing protein, partial [Francisella tularensis]
GHEDIVKYLIRKGADIKYIDRWGKKPLEDAIMNNNISIIELLDRN